MNTDFQGVLVLSPGVLDTHLAVGSRLLTQLKLGLLVPSRRRRWLTGPPNNPRPVSRRL
jgi:hypothetical protein